MTRKRNLTALVLVLFFGLLAFMTLGAPVLRSIAGTGADVILAVITAVTPPP